MTKTENISYVAFLSFIAALGGFLFGYDTAVISGTVTQVTSQFSLTPLQSGWYVGSALVGSIIGVSIGGALSDKLGRKPTMMISAVLFFISAIGCAISPNLDILVISRMIGGAGIGIAVDCLSRLHIRNFHHHLPGQDGIALSVSRDYRFLGAYLMNYYLLNLSHVFQSSNELMFKIFSAEVWRAMLVPQPFRLFCFWLLFS